MCGKPAKLALLSVIWFMPLGTLCGIGAGANVGGAEVGAADVGGYSDGGGAAAPPAADTGGAGDGAVEPFA